MKRIVLFLVAVVSLFLMANGVAFAADPKVIFDDYVEDGRLNGHYTRAELEAYMTDEEIDMYADAPELDAMIQEMLDSENAQHESFPYTGAPVGLMVLASAGLVAAGLGLHRARVREIGRTVQ